MHLDGSSATSDEWGLSVSPQFVLSAHYAMLVFPNQIMQCDSSTSKGSFRLQTRHSRLRYECKRVRVCCEALIMRAIDADLHCVVSSRLRREPSRLRMRQKCPPPPLANHNVITKMSSWCLQKQFIVRAVPRCSVPPII